MKLQPQVGVSVLVIREGKLLLGKRLKSYGYGLWQASGGHLEFNETLKDCAVRELFDETELVAEIRDLEYLCYTEELKPLQRLHYVSFFFVCRNASGTPRNREPDKCGGWEWFDLDELPDGLFELRPVIKEYLPVLKGAPRLDLSIDELREVFRKIASRERGEHGHFLTHLAESVGHADYQNIRLLQPVLMELIEKYALEDYKTYS